MSQPALAAIAAHRFGLAEADLAAVRDDAQGWLLAHIAGPFEQLLGAATQHAAMLRYLDNALSAGPHSRVVARLARRGSDDGVVPRITGLNENLAREVLELHTLGVDGGYTQADVTAFAAVLTGWRAPRLPRGEEASLFDPARHEPGSKTVIGKTYREGAQALHAGLDD